MVNTRILEQRLGWRSNAPDDAPAPPTRPMGHSAVLQGPVDHGTRSAQARGPRRVAVEDAWSQLPRTENDAERLAARAGLVPPMDRGSAAGAAFDHLRTQVMRVMKANDWRRIGVTSPARGAGRSFVAAGLAASIARLETMRVLLVDADLEEPGLSDLFDMSGPGPMEEVLTGQRELISQLARFGHGLAVALNDAPIQFAAELMQSPDAILALRAMNDLLAPDVVILDMPPLLEDSLAQALLPQLDAVLLVSDGRSSTAADIIECERLLDGQVPLLGVALNKSEDREPRRAARRRF